MMVMVWSATKAMMMTLIMTKIEKLSLMMTMPKKKKKKMVMMTKVMIRKLEPTHNSKSQMSKTLTIIMTKDSSN